MRMSAQRLMHKVAATSQPKTSLKQHRCPSTFSKIAPNASANKSRI